MFVGSRWTEFRHSYVNVGKDLKTVSGILYEGTPQRVLREQSDKLGNIVFARGVLSSTCDGCGNALLTSSTKFRWFRVTSLQFTFPECKCRDSVALWTCTALCQFCSFITKGFKLLGSLVIDLITLLGYSLCNLLFEETGSSSSAGHFNLARRGWKTEE
jgi:hypothetical protein